MPEQDNDVPTLEKSARAHSQQTRPPLVAGNRLDTCAREIVLPLGPTVLTADDVQKFALEFDAQPMHLDPVAARASPLGALAASGWQTCARTMVLVEAALRSVGQDIKMLGVDMVTWQKPVRPDDLLHGTLTLLKSPPCNCGSDAAKLLVSMENRKREPVMRWRMDAAIGAPDRGTSLASSGSHCDMRSGRASRVSRRPSPDGLKFFEDVAIGDELDLGCDVISPERCTLFERHTTSGTVRTTPASGVAPDWLIPAAWMHCIVRYYATQAERSRRMGRRFPRLGPAAGVRHMRWHRPVMVGETLWFRAWAERKLEISGRADWGLLVAGAEIAGADGQPVMSFYPQLLLERGPAD